MKRFSFPVLILTVLVSTAVAQLPAPVITSISPTSAAVGSGGFTIQVNGSGFLPPAPFLPSRSTLQWNGSDRTTNVASTTSIQAEILASDVATAGTIRITVRNQDGQVSNAVDFVVGTANPVPTLTSLSPSNATVGGAAFTLTLTGTNFIATSKVRWNGTDRTTTFVSSTQLTAAIPATDIATAGTAQVTVFSPAPGGGLTSAVPFTISAQNPVPSISSLSPIGATVGGAAFTLTVNGANFISSSVVRWNGNDRPTVFVNATQLSIVVPTTDLTLAGAAQITVFNPAPGGGSSTPVSFSISASGPVELDIVPLVLQFQALAASANPSPQTLRISNRGSGSVNWTAQTATVTGGSWLNLSAISGSATAVVPSLVQINASVGGLAAGVYNGTITVQNTAGGTPVVVNVFYNVLPAAPVLQLGQTGLRLTGVPGGSTTPVQDFAVANVGQGTLNWTVRTSTASGGSRLNASPARGTSTVGTVFPRVSVSANLAGLAPGTYYGEVRVTATGATNSPQSVSVVLRVPASGSPGAEVNPIGMIFVATGGAPPPAAQTTSVASSAAVTANVTVSSSGGNWLDAQPRSLSIAGGGRQALSITAAPGTLPVGLYQGTVTVAFSDGTTQTVTVLFLVLPTTAGAAGHYQTQGLNAAVCVPQRLLSVSRLIVGGAASPVGWPRAIELLAIDDCGSPALSATAVTSFSNGDPPVVLVNLGNGAYSGTWKPGNQADPATVTIRVNQTLLTEATLQFAVSVASNPGVPIIGAGGVVHGASFAKFQPTAPGSIISVFGTGIADSSAGQATSLPLPTILGGATLTIGGVAAPLYYSSAGQINAQVPIELLANSNLQAVIKLNLPGIAAITVPETIALDSVRPGIFLADATQGVVVDIQNRLVNASAPAAANDVVVIYATGLGATNPQAETGKAAPSSPPGVVVVTPVVTIGGRTATVEFAGLTPGFVGLNQINVRIPTGVTPGSNVPLIVSQNGIPSNTVIMAVR